MIKVLKVRDVKTPVRGTSLSAGIDFFVPTDFQQVYLQPGQDVLIPSGIKASFDDNLMLMAAEKSGVSTSRQAVERNGKKAKAEAYDSPTVLGAKIVDADYQGEIHIHVINVGKLPVLIAPNKKIAQFILVPIRYDEVKEVTTEEELFEGATTERGDKGFGNGTGEN